MRVRVPGEAGEDEHGAERQLAPGSLKRGPAAHSATEHRYHRQRQVESRLRSQAPGLFHPDRKSQWLINLCQKEGNCPVPDRPEVIDVEPQQCDNRHCPVAGQNAQRAVPEVSPNRRVRLRMNGGVREWPVEEEAGQREEDRHPDIQSGQHTSEAGERVGQPAEKRDVVDDDAQYRYRAESFQCRQPTIRTDGI
nr:hypothetical protein [Micromonospora sp. MH99]